MLEPPVGVTLEEYQDKLYNDSITHARITFITDNIVFQDEELEQGGIQLSTYMNHSENMEFGSAYSSEVIVHFLQTSKLDDVNFNHEFMLEFGVEINGAIQWVSVGRFTGTKPVQDITSNVIELTAYDRMVRFDRDAYDFIKRLTFPCTLQDIYDELCEFVVLDNVSGDEIPSVMNRQIASAEGFEYFASCRDILSSIAEANGCYAKINTDGQVKMVWFEDHTSDQSMLLDNCFGGSVIRLEKSYSKKWGSVENLKWEDVETTKYSEYDNNNNPFEYTYIKYVYGEGEDTEEIVQPPYDPYYNHRLWANVENMQWETAQTMKWKEFEAVDDIVGNVYTISQNPFLMYDTEADIRSHMQFILDKLYSFRLRYVAYINMVGDWLIEPGDMVMLEVMKDTFVEYPIFNRVLKWNGSCSCDYETTGTLAS